MSKQLYDALEECLKLMEEGATLEQCLKSYPRLAETLRPILEAAFEARSLSKAEVPLEAINRSRTRLLVNAAKMRRQDPPRRAWMRLPRLAFSLLILAILLITTSGGLFAASAKSLPGDTLYPVKRAMANIRVNLATGTEHENETESKYRLQRVNEVSQLLEMQLVRRISFEGLLDNINADQWIVSGVPVRVSGDTIIIGTIVEGVLVEVEGSTELEGFVSAQEIHLREYQMKGVVDKIERWEWTISGVRVKITSETQISLGIEEGDVVLALVHSEDDYTLNAKAILNLGQPTATSTAQPTVTPTTDLMDQDSQGADSTEAEKSGDDSGHPFDDDKETITPKPKDNGDDKDEGGDDEVTPEPEVTDDDQSETGDEVPTEEPDEHEEPESTPSPDDKDSEATAEPEETDEP